MVALINKVLLLFVLLEIAVVLGDDVKDEKYDNIDRGSRSDSGGLWFGPRLGKRSSWVTNEDDRQTFLRLLEAADALRYYYDQLSGDKIESERDTARSDSKVSKKIILTPKLGRSMDRYESVDFTPRLGRRRSDQALGAEEQYRQDPELDNRRFFSPRLGRTNFSPRLGREIAYELYPEKIRMVRSVNKTNAN